MSLMKNISVILILLTSLAQANQTPVIVGPYDLRPVDTKDELIHLCNDALESCKKSNDIKDKVILEQDSMIKSLGDQNVKLQEDLSPSLIKSPVLWFIVGFAAGVIVIKR